MAGQPPHRKRPELLMPVSDEAALRQFEIEALRQITDNLRRLNEKMDDQGKAMNAMDVRLARIESNRMDGDVDEMRQMLLRVKDRLAKLEEDKHRRDGAVSALEWVFKNWPGILGFFALIALILGLTGKLGKL
jgi:predicted nuclease with TOPRIM domain